MVVALPSLFPSATDFFFFFFGEVRIDLVYIIFSPSCWEGIAHSRGFAIKKSGCLPPLPLRSGANWCPADVGVGTPGDAPRLRMSRAEVGKVWARGVSARASSIFILSPILEADPRCGRILLVPSSPPEGAGGAGLAAPLVSGAVAVDVEAWNNTAAFHPHRQP